MRRKRFQRGSLKIRIRNGKKYWYVQWRENGQPKSKELGLCSSMSQGKAEAELAEVLKPINKLAGQRQDKAIRSDTSLRLSISRSGVESGRLPLA
jgi:hypothetical protein